MLCIHCFTASALSRDSSRFRFGSPEVSLCPVMTINQPGWALMSIRLLTRTFVDSGLSSARPGGNSTRLSRWIGSVVACPCVPGLAVGGDVVADGRLLCHHQPNSPVRSSRISSARSHGHEALRLGSEARSVAGSVASSLSTTTAGAELCLEPATGRLFAPAGLRAASFASSTGVAVGMAVPMAGTISRVRRCSVACTCLRSACRGIKGACTCTSSCSLS
ncbi:hypothetical protein SAMN05216189_104113 [Pseudomonas delhiensis]|uniref:Uncharacterized protein n=1 Tax=Pseudomonas delhiensis TaxID=366289 RepID=A0A239N4H9_9PSED|nr:hypothetical protein SAMN05216189_104113 [Pseudomonas delhiensis]SNT49846.1 hypothetical protein SAMN06295949_13713 [Pseudomonas delhiensis]